MQCTRHVYFNSFLYATQNVATSKLFRLLESIFLELENVKKDKLKIFQKRFMVISGEGQEGFSHKKAPLPVRQRG
ncbi:hypothetical protein ABE28_017465 [Peribacillus muralis]|uniref:Uncharacterized protein n=1 Tax=Peribacillus muralis TaxID=264697 RepID=A0A1B3XSG8_9BACI|nr:hypothetical protein ABE28_017465 [Peribacillus muralis]